ncbi:MAG: hypothetical protein ACKOC8_06920 [Pirellulales bacterium]
MSGGHDTNPIGEALAWVSRIVAIGLTMFVPGVAGGWIDARLGTNVIGPLGFAGGLGLAIFWLTRLRGRHQERRP